MNPEFQRNVWLELTPLRLAILVAGLLLAFFAAAVAGGPVTPGNTARVLYYFLVVFWGTRNAARSVVGEIRDRTWDVQRLSSLRASTMMWGKLFGSTVFNWVGGAICLVVIVADAVDRSGVSVAFSEFVYLLALGVIAQAVSLFASLIAAGRRQSRAPFEIFLYQIAGLVAAAIVGAVADPSGPAYVLRMPSISWWGTSVESLPFLLLSLAVFAAWVLLGNYRLMRLELKLANGPLVWLAFLAFVTLYVVGFDAWFGKILPEASLPLRRLLLAVFVCSALAYSNVLLEPKRRVFFRWLGSEMAKLHLAKAFSRLQCWMMSYAVALVLGLVLVVQLGASGLLREQTLAGAALGFLTRDMGIVVLFNVIARNRGGDFLAIATLIFLYGLLPSIIAGLHYGVGQALFLPRETGPAWLSPLAAWMEALAVWVLAVTKIALPEAARR